MLSLFTKSNSYTILSPGLFKLTSIPEITVPVNCGVPLTSAVPVFSDKVKFSKCMSRPH